MHIKLDQNFSKDVFGEILGFSCSSAQNSSVPNRFYHIGGTVDNDTNPNPDSVKDFTPFKFPNTTQNVLNHRVQTNKQSTRA